MIVKIRQGLVFCDHEENSKDTCVQVPPQNSCSVVCREGFVAHMGY